MCADVSDRQQVMTLMRPPAMFTSVVIIIIFIIVDNFTEASGMSGFIC